jgi:hypothetical protein
LETFVEYFKNCDPTIKPEREALSEKLFLAEKVERIPPFKPQKARKKPTIINGKIVLGRC